MKVVIPWQHAQHLFSGPLLYPAESGVKQTHVPAKAVDDKTCDLIALFLRQTFQSSDDLSKNAALMDVGHHNYGGAGIFGHA